MAITYTPATNFNAKDSLPTNDSNKVIRGSEFTTEFTAIQTAFSNAAPSASPTFTGTVTISSVDINGGAIDGTTIGGTTPAAATFSSLTATTADINGGTIDGVTIGGSSAGAGSFTTLTTSGAVTHNGGTANGVAYLNGSKVLTTGGALTFDGTALSTTGTINAGTAAKAYRVANWTLAGYSGNTLQFGNATTAGEWTDMSWYLSGSEQMRLTSTGLGIGTSSPAALLHLSSTAQSTVMHIADASGYGTITNSTGSLYLTADRGNVGSKFMSFRVGGTTERMRIDSSGRVGIGTSSPAYKLDVASAVIQFGDSTDAFAQYKSSAGNWHVGANSSNAFAFYSGTYGSGTERMRIDSSGNLGLGVTPSAWGGGVAGLQVKDSTALAYAGTNGYVTTNAYYGTSGGSGFKYYGTGVAALYAQEGAIHKWFTAGSGTAGNTISFSETMRIDSAGNVGIGTSSPGGSLEVRGSDNVSLSSKGNLFVADGGTATQAAGEGGQISFGAWLNGDLNAPYAMAAIKGISESSTTNINNGALIFGTTSALNVTERMRIDSSGNLLVGKTAVDTNTAGFEARSTGFIGVTRADVGAYFTRLTTDGEIIQFRKDSTAVGQIGAYAGSLFIGGTNSGVFFNGNGMEPTSGGSTRVDNTENIGAAAWRFKDIYATNGTIQTSDANEKQDIEELSETERRVAVAAKGLLRKFRWISRVEEKGDDARIHFGIIAQDLQAAFEAEGLDAGRYAMFIHSTWTDEETGEERSRMGVRYSELLAFIIAAL